MSATWLAGPGMFWILGVSWVGFSIFYLLLSVKLGQMTNSESDGWLLGLSNLVFVMLGGLLGLLFLKFPYTILASMGGSILLPALLTLLWVKRVRAR